MIEKIPFGRTGHLSTRTIFGAAALGRVSQADADRTLELLLEYGINHIDTAASYGESELRIGPWMREHRQNFFLATKTGERTYQAARDEIHRSLERLQVERVDLLQLHNLADPEEWRIAMGPGGALEALIEAREQKLVSYIGVTGHGLGIAATHLRSLAFFDFDSVLLPYNYILLQNSAYAADFNTVAAFCQNRNVAIQTIKALCRRPWGEQERTCATWYEPLESQDDINTMVSWVLSRPGIFLNTLGDINILPKVLKAAANPVEQPSLVEMNSMSERLKIASLFV
ncbi:aldo/keto reductase [Candidatus Chlorohelix sp.]|uniref:aldo/keto reductase n=1 Tax=Candidatus Chlorohelix sp. TaxID=3139201 RepID=UPI00302E53CD